MVAMAIICTPTIAPWARLCGVWEERCSARPIYGWAEAVDRYQVLGVGLVGNASFGELRG